jgi:hypothetical protein
VLRHRLGLAAGATAPRREQAQGCQHLTQTREDVRQVLRAGLRDDRTSDHGSDYEQHCDDCEGGQENVGGEGSRYGELRHEASEDMQKAPAGGRGSCRGIEEGRHPPEWG